MIRAFRAELARLARRKTLVVTAITVFVFAVGAAAIVLQAAVPAGRASAEGMAPTLEGLASAGGGTDVFRYAATFAGTLVFVVFVGLFALEFARGTYRTMLLRQPQRVRLLAGKMLALLAFAAVTIAVTEVVMWVAALAEAPLFDVSTGAWTSAHALAAALGDYGAVLLWATGYAVFGMTVAILLRSVPVSLAVGIAWAGPFEHLMQNVTLSTQGYFPGSLLEVVGQGGTATVGFARAALTATAYVVVAAVVSSLVFRRRDVTA